MALSRASQLHKAQWLSLGDIIFPQGHAHILTKNTGMQNPQSHRATPQSSSLAGWRTSSRAWLYLSKLPFPQLLLEAQLLPGELPDGDVLLGEGVHGQGGHRVHVVAGHTLQVHDVGLGVVGHVVLEALVRGGLGQVGLSIVPTAH